MKFSETTTRMIVFINTSGNTERNTRFEMEVSHFQKHRKTYFIQFGFSASAFPSTPACTIQGNDNLLSHQINNNCLLRCKIGQLSKQMD